MPPRSSGGVGAIRQFARGRVEETSLRAVAAEIGMSYSGLRSFLEGREPYTATRGKLLAWYARVQHPDGRPVDPQGVQSAVALLARHLENLSDPRARSTAALDVFREIVSRLDGKGRQQVATALTRYMRS